MVNEVIDPDRKTWDEAQLRTLVSNIDCDAILSIPVAMKKGSDTLVWHYDSKGYYSVKSGYQEAVQQAHIRSNLPGSFTDWSAKEWKFVWSLNLPPKLKHFVGRMYHNVLAIKKNLWRRRCAHSVVCPICLAEVETVEHLLFGYEWAKMVWFGSGVGFRCADHDLGSIRSCFGQLIASIGSACEDRKTLCSMVWVAWCIWKARNAYIFNHILVDLIMVIATAKREEAEFLVACAEASTSTETLAETQCPRPHRVPLPSGLWKLNCDSATDLSRGRGVVVVLLRDDKGNLVDGIAASIRMTTALQGEATAVRLVCFMARALHCATVEVESDCKTLIQQCVSEGVPLWEICAVLNDIRFMASSGGLVFKWSPRIQNRAAHWVALACLREALPVDWVSQPLVALVG
ncbi:putative ribonuclease H protein [Camellia lanceoleosa]|uniref:Ribonuclease H protein n=1 Tax=Camellia lanceoleosa TaxID=1840588 RepID=A0ACC0I4N7_9ERIC|nr:putative ribonuclease H protein [Camellia lanceoleosa]